MNPILILAAMGGVAWWASRKVKKTADSAAAVVVGNVEGTVVDLGTAPLPSNAVPIQERDSDPTTPGKVFVIPRLLEILEPQDGATVSRPGLLGSTYPVTVRWTNTLALPWSGKLTATVSEGNGSPRSLDLGTWVIAGGDERSAVISVGFGGGRINIGSTLVKLTLDFNGSKSTAMYYVD